MSSITLIGAVKTVYTDGKTRFRREYRGLKSDFGKLPKDDDLASGSICRFVDTGEYAEYFAKNQTWYLNKGSAGGSGTGSGGGTTNPDEESPDNTATDEEVKDLLDSIFGSSEGGTPSPDE